MLKTPKEITEDNKDLLPGVTPQELGYLRKFKFIRGRIIKRQSFIEESDVLEFYKLNVKIKLKGGIKSNTVTLTTK